MKSRFNFHPLVMIFSMVIIVAVMTWIIPGGEYERKQVNGKTQVVSNSFKQIEGRPQGIGAIMTAPVKGFTKAAEIIVFLLVIGGAFMVVQKTEAINACLQRVAEIFAQRPHLQKFFIPVTMTLFSLGGSIFGMCEEVIPFIPIFIPLAMSLGYDSLVGVAIPFLGAAAGFAGSTLNPFTVGIALKICELPYNTGLGYRIFVWIISTVFTIAFVMWYAAKIKRNPETSAVYEIDQARPWFKNKQAMSDKSQSVQDVQREESFGENQANSGTILTKAHIIIMSLFALTMVVLVVGILKYEWFIIEIAGLFFSLGILAGIVGGMSASEIADSFKEGAKDMVGVALIIACAKSLLVIAEDGKIIDTMLYHMGNSISHLPKILAAQGMFVTQSILNFFIHSGSGQAALTMPVMGPLADVLGMTRFTAVLAFQFGEGWINPALPTSGVTMGILGLAGIPYEKWFRWLLPMQIFFFIVALLLLIPPVLLQW
ncbi:MAG: putative basic amino acid antiporter YfcC [Candidatus Riflebacteria bacterium]|nr:putative basic amino acid antiporter YfcC [Candidatus Riflebacteria bacterium]